MKAPVNTNINMISIIDITSNMKANMETTTTHVNANTNMKANVNALTTMDAQLNKTI